MRGRSAVNLLARGRLHEAWTLTGMNYRAHGSGEEQLLHVRRGTQAADLALRRDGTLRIQFRRGGRTVAVEARCRPR